MKSLYFVVFGLIIFGVLIYFLTNKEDSSSKEEVNWVAVGSVMSTSSNGIDWNDQTVGSNTLNSVAYGNGLWVAVGSVISTSSNGIDWNDQTVGPNTLNSVAYGNGLWVAVGDNVIATSSNGIDWDYPDSDAYSLNSVAYGNGLWFAAGGGILLEITTSSIDGNTVLSFKASSWSQDVIKSVSYGNNQWILIVEPSSLGTPFKLYLSTDNGSSWNDVFDGEMIGTARVGMGEVTYGKDMWLLSRGWNGSSYKSTNGQDWVELEDPTVTFVDDLSYGNGIWIRCNQYASSTGPGIFINDLDISKDNGQNWRRLELTNNPERSYVSVANKY